MDNNNKRDRRGDKKKALIIFIVLAAALVILPLLNMINFNSLINTDDEDNQSLKGSTIVTLGDHHFETPDYDEDIMLDTDYLEQNRHLHYTYENETFEVVDDAGKYGRLCEFFQKYFDAAIEGDCETYNALFTGEYIEKNGEKKFTAQKIYNISVKCLRSAYLENGDANGEYVGYTVYYYDVSYNILNNNGTLRNDFLGDESYMPLVYEVIEGNDEIKISAINAYNTSGEKPVETGFKNGTLLLILAITCVVLLLCEILTKKYAALSVLVACLVGVLLALLGIDQTVVIAVTLLCAALFVTLRFTVLKKYLNFSKSRAKKELKKVNDNRNG